jgi:hypothetical protein
MENPGTSRICILRHFRFRLAKTNMRITRFPQVNGMAQLKLLALFEAMNAL